MTSASDFDIDVGEEVRRVRTSRHLDGSWDWFQRLWGVAVIAHIVGNPAIGQVVGGVTPRGLASFALGLLAVTAILRADDRRLLIALALGVPITALLELPVLGNHWLLASVVSVALAVALVFKRSWEWFGTTARAMLLTFYGFAVFAKLNAAFFDDSVSCAVVYANQGLAAVGLPTLVSGSWPAAVLPYVVVVVEALVFLMLLLERSRFAAVVLALVFHTVISFDLGQHFYDFTSVLYPLFLLFLPLERLDRLGEYLPERTQVLVGVTLSLFVVMTVIPSTGVTSVVLNAGFFFVWIPFALGMLVFVGLSRVSHHAVALRPTGGVAWLLVALIGLNGLMPYVEVKTAHSWNMYSNLAVVNGESNHLLVRQGLPVFGGHGDLVEIIASSDPGLQQYIGSDWLLTTRGLYAYLSGHPDAEVRYRQGAVTSFRPQGVEVETPNLLFREFAVFRAVDATAPIRCQSTWLPAN